MKKGAPSKFDAMLADMALRQAARAEADQIKASWGFRIVAALLLLSAFVIVTLSWWRSAWVEHLYSLGTSFGAFVFFIASTRVLEDLDFAHGSPATVRLGAVVLCAWALRGVLS